MCYLLPVVLIGLIAGGIGLVNYLTTARTPLSPAQTANISQVLSPQFASCPQTPDPRGATDHRPMAILSQDNVDHSPAIPDGRLVTDPAQPFNVVAVLNVHQDLVGRYDGGGLAYRVSASYCVFNWPEQKLVRTGTVSAEPPQTVYGHDNEAVSGWGDLNAAMQQEIARQQF